MWALEAGRVDRDSESVWACLLLPTLGGLRVGAHCAWRAVAKSDTWEQLGAWSRRAILGGCLARGLEEQYLVAAWLGLGM